MRKEMKIHAILYEFAQENTAPNVAIAIGFSPETVRVYANYMVNNNLLQKLSSDANGIGGIPRYSYIATGLLLTDEILKQVQLDIYFHYENMKKKYQDKQHKIAKANKIIFAKVELKMQTPSDKSDDEKKGIYKLSTSPSDYFKDKFKAQNQQATSERKSPKNYAGTSAGMVW
jgi:hypothetical protein